MIHSSGQSVKKEATRKAIVEAARARFRRFGIRKTTMHEVAEDAGLAVGTIYLYFKSKDDLILGCAERFAKKHRQFADDLLRSKLAPDEKLESARLSLRKSPAQLYD